MKQTFELGERVRIHGFEVGYIVRNKHYRLDDGFHEFGIYYGINYNEPDGKPQKWVQENQVSKFKPETYVATSSGFAMPIWG